MIEQGNLIFITEVISAFDKKWYSNGKEVKVDKWCEIPTFDKE